MNAEVLTIDDMEEELSRLGLDRISISEDQLVDKNRDSRSRVYSSSAVILIKPEFKPVTPYLWQKLSLLKNNFPNYIWEIEETSDGPNIVIRIKVSPETQEDVLQDAIYKYLIALLQNEGIVRAYWEATRTPWQWFLEKIGWYN